MMKVSGLKSVVIAAVVLLMLLPIVACPAPPPPPPPPPPAGTLSISPPKIDYATLEKMWPKVGKALKFPEPAIAKLPPAIAIMGIPIKFSGSGWPPGETITIELVIPAGVVIPGVEPGVDAVGIAFAIADAGGKFEATMEATAKINFLLRGSWTEILSVKWAEVKPLPAGTYTIRAVGVDPRTATLSLGNLVWSNKGEG